MANHETPYGVWKEFNNYEFRPDEIINTICDACGEPAEGIGRVHEQGEQEEGYVTIRSIEVIEYFCRDCCYLLLHARITPVTEQAKKDRKIYWLRHHMTSHLEEKSKTSKKALALLTK